MSADTGEATNQHLRLLELLQHSLNLLVETGAVKVASGPVLLHPDPNTRNIFFDAADHTKVTGIIDWQSAAVEPAFVAACQVPDFVQELPEQDDSEDLTDEVQAHNAKIRVDVEYCVKMWSLWQQAPKELCPASRLDYSLLRVLAAPGFGWTGNKILLEMSLDDTGKEWKKLALPSQSVYQPDGDADTVQHLDDYHATLRLRKHFIRVLRCGKDGYVSNDRWQDVLQQYRVEYSRYVDSAIESEGAATEAGRARAVAMADRHWPFFQR